MQLYEKTFKYFQENDSCDEQFNGQTLRVQTQDAGGGQYIIISTERWAIELEDVDKFCAELKSILDGVKSIGEE